MNLHLVEIAAAVTPGSHAVLMIDQAGWHMSTRLVVPHNITILPLPPRSPELNPVENIWQFMRDNWLSNRIFKSYEDLVDHCCGFSIPHCRRRWYQPASFLSGHCFVDERLEEEPGALGPRCVKDVIEEKLFDRRANPFTDSLPVFIDTASLSFYGEGGGRGGV